MSQQDKSGIREISLFIIIGTILILAALFCQTLLEAK
jgi:hypothetical protein